MEKEPEWTAQLIEGTKDTFVFLKECVFPKEATGRGYADGISDATAGITKNTRMEIGVKYAFSISSASRENFGVLTMMAITQVIWTVYVKCIKYLMKNQLSNLLIMYQKIIISICQIKHL